MSKETEGLPLSEAGPCTHNGIFELETPKRIFLTGLLSRGGPWEGWYVMPFGASRNLMEKEFSLKSNRSLHAVRDILGWPRSCNIVLVRNHATNEQRSADQLYPPLEEGFLRLSANVVAMPW